MIIECYNQIKKGDKFMSFIGLGAIIMLLVCFLTLGLSIAALVISMKAINMVKEKNREK